MIYRKLKLDNQKSKPHTFFNILSLKEKALIILAITTFFFNLSYSQTKAEYGKDLGLLGKILGADVKAGVTFGYLYRPKGEYVYLLNQNATVKETVENKNASNISMIVLIPLEEKSRYNFLLNVSFKEIKDISTDGNGLFNNQTPFGLGFSWYPFNKIPYFGLSIIANYGKVNRLRPENIDSNPNDVTFFPIADHKDYNLNVDAPVPDGLLKPYFKSESSFAYTAAITLRF